MPLKLLRNIIQSSEAIGDSIGDFYQKRVADPVQHFGDDVERRVKGFFKRERDDEGEEGEQSPESQAEDEEAKGAVRELVSSTQEAFEGWQRRIDERVKETLSRMTHLTHVGTDVADLQKRIDELEARLKELGE
jgi:hypothetical protein